MSSATTGSAVHVPPTAEAVEIRARPCESLACGKCVIRTVERCHPRCNFAYFQLVISGLLFFATAGGASYSIGYFTDDFIRDLELSRTELSGAWAASLAGTALTMPLLGRLTDRYGPRCILFVLTIEYILAITLLGLLPKKNIVVVTMVFYLSRSSMAGSQMIGLNVTNQWWIKQKAKAMAVTNATASWAIIFPSFLAALDHAYGWRDAMFIQVVVCGFALILLALLTFNRPETYNYWPDASQRWDQPVPPAPARELATELTALPADDTNNAVDTNTNGATHINGHTNANTSYRKEMNGQYAQLTDSDHQVSLSPSNGHTNSVNITITPSTPKSGIVPSSSQGALAAAAATLTIHDSDTDPSTTNLTNTLINNTDIRSDDTADINSNTTGSGNSDMETIALGPVNVAKVEVEEIHWHWNDAVRTPAFWIVNLAACALSLLWSGFNFHYISFLEDHNIPASTGGYLFTLVAAGAFVTMFIAGYSFDRIENKARGMILGTVTNIIVLLMLLTMTKAWHAAIFGFIYGMMDGVLSIGYQAVFAFQFGRVHLATINAIATSFSMSMLGAGPLIFGAVRERTGTYDGLLIGLLVIGVLSTILLYVTPAPRPPRRRLNLAGVVYMVDC